MVFVSESAWTLTDAGVVRMASIFYTSDAGSLRRTWLPLVAWGVLVTVFGIAVTAWPDVSGDVFIFMVGLASVIAGLVWMSWIVSVRQATGGWWLFAFVPGALLLMFGAYALINPGSLQSFIFQAIGIVAALWGLADMVASWRWRGFFDLWWMRLVRGLLTAAAGVIVFLHPEAGTIGIVAIGLLFVAIGAMTISLGLGARRLPKSEGAIVIKG